MLRRRLDPAVGSFELPERSRRPSALEPRRRRSDGLYCLKEFVDLVLTRQPAPFRDAWIYEVRSRSLITERRPERDEPGPLAEIGGIVGNAGSFDEHSGDREQIRIALHLETAPTAYLRRTAVGADDDARALSVSLSVELVGDRRLPVRSGLDAKDRRATRYSRAG